MDVWRLKHRGRSIRIVRLRVDGAEEPVIEGVWHGGRAAARHGRAGEAADHDGGDGGDAASDHDALRELLDLIVGTSAADWHVVPTVEPTSPGTTFIGGPTPGDLQHPLLELRHRSAVLRRDPAVTLAWDFDPEPGRGRGLTALGRGTATGRTAEVRLRGSVVHRPTYLDFQRGVIYLPTPLREEPAGTFAVRAWDLRLVGLLNELAGRSQYEAFCSRLGLVEEAGHPLDRTE